MTNRLILAPHADDEVLGCGGTLAKYPDECTVLVAADKGDGRMEEFHRARKRLGYASWLAGNFVTGTLADQMRALTGFLDDILWEIKPQVLYVPFPSMHQDHVALYEASLRTARLGFSNNHWYPPTVVAYDVSAYPTNLYQTGLAWNIAEPLTERHIAAKEAAFGEYESQTTSAHPMLLREEARVRGAQHSLEYAERFALVRCVGGVLA